MRTLVFKTAQQASHHVVVLSTSHAIAVVVGVDISEPEFVRASHQVKLLVDGATHIKSVEELETKLSTFSTELHIAIMLHTPESALLGTTGRGMIFLKRDAHLDEIVSDGFCAEGAMAPGDEFVITTEHFLDQVGGYEGLSYYFTQYSSDEVVEMMQTYEESQGVFGFAVYLDTLPAPETEVSTEPGEPVPDTTIISDIKTQDISDDETIVEQEVTRSLSGEDEQSPVPASTPQQVPRSFLQVISTRMRTIRPGRLPRISKKWLLIILPTVFLIFLAVRVSPWIREMSAQSETEYQAFETQIMTRLKDAQTESFLDIEKTTGIFAQISKDIDSLNPSTKQKYADKVVALQKQVADKRKEYLRIKSVVLDEYFDLAVEKPNLDPIQMVADEENLYILDASQSTVFRVSLEKRSYDVIESAKLAQATHITVSDSNIYVLVPDEGIYLLGDDKTTKVITKDGTWSKVTAMDNYNGNLYLLDDAKKDIFKYLGSDETSFASASSYLVPSERDDFTGGEMMFIQSSVYIAGDGTLAKYTSGTKEDLRIMLPRKAMTFTSLSVSQTGDMYLLASDGRSIVILDKSGAFQGQIEDEKVLSMKAIATTPDVLYILAGTKIFKVQLQVPTPTVTE